MGRRIADYNVRERMEKIANPPAPGSCPERVISLVPSVTESIVTLGLGHYLVGVTDFCPIPDSLEGIARIGGPKDVRFSEMIALHPDLVIANQEENEEEAVNGLRASGLTVWLTYPRTVREALADLRDLVLLYPHEHALPMVTWLERAVDWMDGSRTGNPVTVFCPIWREGESNSPIDWTTFNRDTYANDLLAICGARNVFAGKDTSRYPHITPEEVMAAHPEMILLPDEPFRFGEEDAVEIRKLMPDIPAVQTGRVLHVDGRLLFWHGTKIGESIRTIPTWLSQYQEPKSVDSANG